MSHPSSVPLLLAREREVLRRCDATLPVDFPGSDAVFAAGAAVGPYNTHILLSSNHHDGMDSVGRTTDIATGPQVPHRCSSTHTVDFPEAGPVVCLTSTFQEGDHLLSGEVLHSDRSTVELLPLYLADRDRDPLAADDPTTDMDAMHPRHTWLPSRRSARILGPASTEAQRNATLHSTAMPPTRPRLPQDTDTISTRPTKKWLDSHGQLVRPEGGWSIETTTHAIIGRDSIFGADSTALSARVPTSRAGHSKPSKGCKTKCGLWPPAQKIECVFARGNVLPASAFLMLSDASYKPRTVYVLRRLEWANFMFRSFRAKWLMDHAEEVEVAHDILVGEDSSSDAIRDLCRDGLQETVVRAASSNFLACKTPGPRRCIVKRIIIWISDVVEIVLPGIAHQFKQDAKWHEERYGIKSLFGLFWNLCLNAWFHDQRSIHCGPHADKKKPGWLWTTWGNDVEIDARLRKIGILAVTTDAPESNDAPEQPNVNVLLFLIDYSLPRSTCYANYRAAKTEKLAYDRKRRGTVINGDILIPVKVRPQMSRDLSQEPSTRIIRFPVKVEPTATNNKLSKETTHDWLHEICGYYSIGKKAKSVDTAR
ncbi:hypothetical protein B0H17DRAFT_1140796 [Mycena rosella]|uniref:Uncharacterized protein n=1 Tax=Mycena rosella TaxID=1033263 RepID=A0AAD7G6Y8_MYCRO|nr:hypothetical protein B0H17DRAFT_1140796 [Mycena rosella]